MTAAETSTSSARRQDFFILLHCILFILYTAETFLKVIFCCNFEVFYFGVIYFGEHKCDCSPHKSALSCFGAFSVPCPGLLC